MYFIIKKAIKTPERGSILPNFLAIIVAEKKKWFTILDNPFQVRDSLL